MTVRGVAIGALIVSLVIGLSSNVLFLAAFQFRSDWFLEPTLIVAGGASSGELLRWASLLDLIGYYLATGALAYALWRILRPRDPTLADLSALAALAFTVAGGAAAAVLGMVGPLLMQQHAVATGADQEVIAGQIALLFELVWRAVWQLFDGLMIGAWTFGIGMLLRRDQHLLSRLSLALAAASVIGTILNALGLDLGRDAALGVVFTLWTIWWVLLLRAFLRNDSPFGQEPLSTDGAERTPAA